MFSNIQSPGADQSLTNSLSALYFMTFIFVSAFVCVELVIGVLVETFTRLNGTALLTQKQRYWVDIHLCLG